MAFIASETWSTYVTHFEHGSFADYVFKLGFIWLTVLAAIISLRHGKWIPNVGAILKIVFLAMFMLTAVIYAARHGLAGLATSDFSPPWPACSASRRCCCSPTWGSSPATVPPGR